jgi:hypothetical protein
MVDTILTPGDDLFNAPGGQADTINGIGGNDTLNGNDQNDSLLGGDGNDRLDGGSQNDTVRGEAGDDTILNPSAGNDLLDGGADNDSIVGGSGNETILGGGGTDTVLAGGGNDSVDGGAGDDSIIGGGYGIETLSGGAGNDFIQSGGGDRVLFGGSGNDTFSGFTNDSTTKFVSGGGGTERAIFNTNFEPSALSLVPGNVTINGTSYAYQASYVTTTGYRVYFAEFDGSLQFNNTLVDLGVICFAEGTMIMTPAGERAVQTLRAGDLVVTAAGHGAPVKPVRWVGHRRVDLDTHPRARDVAPVLVLPGALGQGIPHRPLRVSPEHALLVDGALVPAGLLVDGTHILRMQPRGSVTYFHVELDAHDLLIAEGAPTESYLDMGNRAAFADAGPVAALHADFGPAPGVAAEGCLPRVTAGEALEAKRQALALRRAGLARRAG